MKKSTIIFTALILSALCLISVVNTANADTPQSAGTDIYFYNPSSVVVIDGNLYVANNIGADKCSIFCLDATNYQYKYSYACDCAINNLCSINGYLYAVSTDKTLVLDVSTSITLSKTLTVSAVDFAYYNGNTYFFGNKFGQVTESGSQPFPGSLNAKSCAIVNDAIYYLNVQDTTGIYFYNTNSSATNVDILSLNIGKNLAEAKNIFAMDGTNLGITFENSICVVNTAQENILDGTFNAVQIITLENSTIVDATYCGGYIYILDNDSKVQIFNKVDTTWQLEKTIGSDEVTEDEPKQQDFTSYTLASSNGYPTNIVYKTSSTNTEFIKDNTNQFIIIGYQGCENSSYYYVYTNGKFGWIRKSDNCTKPESDSQIAIIDTIFNSDATYQTKFNSLNAVYIYRLPTQNSEYVTYLQSATNQTDVVILQKFVESNTSTTWYYVSYLDNATTCYGFVKQGDIGNFTIKEYKNKPTKVIGKEKIDASLFNAVNIYANEDFDEKEIVCQEDGEPLKLYSGKIVTVVKRSDDGEKSYIEVQTEDGKVIYGWMLTENLIDDDLMPQSITLALSLIVAAVSLCIGAIVIIVRHNIAQKRAKNSYLSSLEYTEEDDDDEDDIDEE